LDFIENTQRHIKANKQFLDLEFLQNQLIKVGHQIWQIIQLGYCDLQPDGLALVINEFDNESLLRTSHPWAPIVGVHPLNLVHIELLNLIRNVFDVVWWVKIWLVLLDRFAQPPL
jgi:hypothetical protein